MNATAHPTSNKSLGSFSEEKPTCAVRCANIVEVICGGPKTGCGKLKSFNNPCMLAGWNCNHKSHRKFKFRSFLSVKQYVTVFLLFFRI